MFKILQPVVFLLTILTVSCSRQQFTTAYNLPVQNGANQIGSYEVSVRDWITYMVTTSFTSDDDWVYLGDHKEEIVSKIPDLSVGGWSSYTINAFLVSKNNLVYTKSRRFYDVHDHCTNNHFGLYVPPGAWDSIEKFNMLDLPVVGITYEQAMDYLVYKQAAANDCHRSGRGENEYRYECFLPAPEQFDSVQTTMDSLNTKLCHLFNYKEALCRDCPNAKKYMKNPVLSRIGKEPVPVTSYFPNDFGLYNIKGNVAEMTSVKGIAKGGSCQHYASEAYAGKFQEYTKPEVWLGFRVWYRVVPN